MHDVRVSKQINLKVMERENAADVSEVKRNQPEPEQAHYPSGGDRRCYTRNHSSHNVPKLNMAGRLLGRQNSACWASLAFFCFSLSLALNRGWDGADGFFRISA